MGRSPCCTKVGLRKGPWTPTKDALLINYIQEHGEGKSKFLPRRAGLLRCRKSCRLRWKNYLRTDIKRGNITVDEEDLILRFHSLRTLLGNRWSLKAARLAGRNDNEIKKNYWNCHLSRRLRNKITNPNSSEEVRKCDREPKKRKNTAADASSEMKQMKNKQNDNEDLTKTKIHYPKAVRVSSLPIIRNYSFDNIVGDIYKGVNTQVSSGLLRSWSDLSDGGEVLVSDENQEVDNSDFFDLSWQYSVPTKENMLEKLYKEYQQLLKADDHVQLESFVESLLV